MKVANYKLMPPYPSLYAKSWSDHRHKNSVVISDWEHSKRWVQRHNLQVTQWLLDGDERASRELAEPQPIDLQAIALQEMLEGQATRRYIKARMESRWDSDECWQDKLTRRRNAKRDSIERTA